MCTQVLPAPMRFPHLRTRETGLSGLFVADYSLYLQLKESSKLPTEAPDTETKYQAAEQAEAKQGVP